MKKVKVYLMMSILAIVLCACGAKDSNDKLTESDLDNMSETELEEVIEQEIEKLDELEGAEEEQKVEEEVIQEESFECLPEVMNSSLEDCLIQIDNTILRRDQSMTLYEAVEAMQNSGVEYAFKVNDADYNSSMLVAPYASIAVEVYKNGNHYFSLMAQNNSNETVSGDSENLILTMFAHYSPEFWSNSYCCKGIRSDGYGQTYGTIKELLKDYADYMVERSTSIAVDGTYYQGIEMEIKFTKDDLDINATLRFKSDDGSCVQMYVSGFKNLYY